MCGRLTFVCTSIGCERGVLVQIAVHGGRVRHGGLDAARACGHVFHKRRRRRLHPAAASRSLGILGLVGVDVSWCGAGSLTGSL